MKATFHALVISCILILGTAFQLRAQSAKHGQPFPAGVYLTYDAVNQRKPDLKCELDVSTRSTVQLNNFGGHFHDLHQVDKCLSYRQFKKLVAYSDGETIYFRGAFIDQESGFFGSKNTGKYLPFYHYLQPQTQGIIVITGGVLSSILITAALNALIEVGNNESQLPVHFLDMETLQTYPLNNTTLLSLLRQYPDLLAEYEDADKSTFTLDDYFAYLQRMN